GLSRISEQSESLPEGGRAPDVAAAGALPPSPGPAPHTPHRRRPPGARPPRPTGPLARDLKRPRESSYLPGARPRGSTMSTVIALTAAALGLVLIYYPGKEEAHACSL